ncbi:hypothetical protein ORI20_14340 [Mycobacterium sp. CVI_P3]|uniref:HEPN domain-containing protein n=1 Tax=Mycobacterium pinniadriaticum TaxID=2994102 RepID=A0ABT3SEF0_9MYCO|nr:hypothetical protein [Mycobacterium pinniadriaticum]MCX2931459.1 hypothetical protein [Mycobacterium pinniadriaticum]MCX2937883.1 hypothetical protein [Mycobacterium pinniadriaticum]
MSERTRPSTESIRRGRLRKAVEFLDGAILIDGDMPDAAVSLLVNAGIAAADVICGVRLGIYAAGENHNEAVALFAKADAGVEKHLRTLLNVKSKVSYTHQSATADERKRSRRAAEALVQAARRAAASG